MELQGDAIHQAQRTEGILGDLTAQTTLHLIAKLLDTSRNESVIEFIVTIHVCPQAAMKSGSAWPWPSA
jgi:hypothetical protein